MSKIAKLLPLLEDVTSYPKLGETNGDSAQGFFQSPDGSKFIIKKSKKSNPEEQFDSDEDREQAILNDLCSEYIASLIANELPLTSAQYKLARKDDFTYYIVILSKSFLNQEGLQLIHGSQMFDYCFPNPEISHLDVVHKRKVKFFTLDTVLKVQEEYLKVHVPSISNESIKNIQEGFLRICFFGCSSWKSG